jgi:hypothetical protein
VVIDADPASQCLMWARASRRRLYSAMALQGTGDPQDALAEADRAGELRLGLIALDHALNAARWVLQRQTERTLPTSPAPPAATVGAADLSAFEEVRERVRGIRNVITHFDDRIATGYLAEIEVTPDGLTARQRGITLALSFLEWDRWLDELESFTAAPAGPPS